LLGQASAVSSTRFAMPLEAPVQVWDLPTTVASGNDLCPLLLILREADSRFIVGELGVILQELYAGSEGRPILFPFARGYLETVDRIMDPIVAAHGCHKRGISYLPDTCPWELLEAALDRWGECPVVSDRTTVEFASRRIRTRRREPLAGGPANTSGSAEKLDSCRGRSWGPCQAWIDQRRCSRGGRGF